MIADDIGGLLRDAMRAKDERTINALRMLKTKLAEKKTSPGFSGELTDAVVQDVAAAYVKTLEKALVEYQAAGDRAAGMREELKFEIDYLQRFLPKRLDEAKTREIVAKAIAESGAKEPREAGKVVGVVMKTHKGQIEPAMAKKIAEELLGGSA
jgi:uncharacterized protein